MATTMAAISAITWPSTNAARLMGSDRNRSTMPSCMSVAIETPGPIIPKASVWTRIPPTRYSW